MSGFVLSALFLVIGLGVYSSMSQPDIQCSSFHIASSQPPVQLTTFEDYFAQGNYDYDRGDCQQAVKDYTKAIMLNPSFPQAYNNRAYTYMRLRNFQSALTDLNKALTLNPNYVQALMNRGDIHNYYYQIDRPAAIMDYEKVIAITGPDNKETNACGHLFLARHNGWTLSAFLDFFTGGFRSCK